MYYLLLLLNGGGVYDVGHVDGIVGEDGTGAGHVCRAVRVRIGRADDRFALNGRAGGVELGILNWPDRPW
jgi:hypothetical protein